MKIQVGQNLLPLSFTLRYLSPALVWRFISPGPVLTKDNNNTAKPTFVLNGLSRPAPSASVPWREDGVRPLLPASSRHPSPTHHVLLCPLPAGAKLGVGLCHLGLADGEGGDVLVFLKLPCWVPLPSGSLELGGHHRSDLASCSAKCSSECRHLRSLITPSCLSHAALMFSPGITH